MRYALYYETFREFYDKMPPGPVSPVDAARQYYVESVRLILELVWLSADEKLAKLAELERAYRDVTAL